MGRRSRGRSGVLRRFGALAIGAGIAAAGLVAPSPAWAIPPGGWCYNQFYNATNNLGQTHNRYGSTKHFHNLSSSTANWSESISVTTTFTSTYTYTTTVRGGIDLGIVNLGAQYTTTATIYNSITVNKTTGFTVPVPPQTLMYADYGAYGQSTSGTYYSYEYACDDPSWTGTNTSTALQAFSLTSEGWRLWEG